MTAGASGGFRPPASLALALSLAAGAAGAQAADTTRAPDPVTAETAAVTLTRVEIRASILPTAGPAIGSAVPARISLVSGRQIDAWEPRTLADVLSAQAGVSFHDDLGSPYKLNLTTRGFTAGPTVGTPSGVSVFLDGVRQNEPGAQEVNFDLLPMEHVDHVELLSGAASLLGPNSLGGAVNLVMRRGTGPPQGELEISAGSFGSASAEASFAGGTPRGLDYYAGGGYERERGWREATSASNYNGFVNLGRLAADRGVRFQAHAARSRAETAGSLPESIFATSPRVNFTPGDFEDLDMQQVALAAHAPLSAGRASFRTYARRSAAERFNVNQPPDEDVRGLTLNQSLGVSGDWLWSSNRRTGFVGLRTGLDAAGHRVRGRIFLEDPDGAGGSDSLTTDVRSPSWDAAAYVIADHRLGRVATSGGARYDYVRIPFRNVVDPGSDTVSSFSRLSPRLGLSIDLGRGALLYASTGRSFRAPAILELGCADPEAACPLPFALGDDPPLDPVRATTYELGGRWTRRAVVLNASAFRTDVRDEIFFVTSEVARLGGYFTNVARTRRTGAEFAAQLWLPGDRLYAYAKYAWTVATFQSRAEVFSLRADDDFEDSPLAGPNDVDSGDRLPLIPEHQLKGGMLVRIGGGEFGLDARYIGRQWLRGDEANETSALAPYALVNARIAAEGRGWGVAVIVNNVLNSRRATFGTFNENRLTDELERFLTPLNARAVRLILRRSFGPGASPPASGA